MLRTGSLMQLFWAACLGLLLQIGPSLADKRVALIIGNSNYKNTPALTNPGNDASDIGQALKAVGFEVTVKLDASKRQMDQALAQFARDSAKADASLFYYAGHGMQFQGRNFIMPVDAELEDEISLRYELTSLDEVKAALQQSKGVKIMVLDSCRNNPLAQKLVRSISVATRDVPRVEGYSRPEQTRGMIIVYATQADEVANDGMGRNSPFSAAFLRELKEPGLEIGTMFRRVGADVYNATAGVQSPELSISILSEYYLNQAETDKAIWARIRAGADAATLREFLARYPNSFYAPDAAARLDLLEREAREKAADDALAAQKADGASQADRAKREQIESERAAADARVRGDDLAAKLAAAEAEKAKLAAELAQREADQKEADARQRAEKEKADRERAQREADLRGQIARIQTSQAAEKDRLVQEAIEQDRAKQAAADQAAAQHDRDVKDKADKDMQAQLDRAQSLKSDIARFEQQAAQAKIDAAAAEQKAAEARRSGQPAEQKVALASPTAPAAPAGSTLVDINLVPQIRGELQRLGCYGGGEADWTSAEMKHSVGKYALYAKLGPAPDVPNTAMLEDLKARHDRLCPLECGLRETEAGGRCVAKTCGRNEYLNHVGVCVAKPVTPHVVATRAPAALPAARPAAGKGHCFTFNGNNYCE